MEQTSQPDSSFVVCAACPLNKKLYDQDATSRRRILESVERIGEVVSQSDKSMIYGEAPPFVTEILESDGNEGIRREAWICNRVRRLGSCSKMIVVFPHPEYL